MKFIASPAIVMNHESEKSRENLLLNSSVIVRYDEDRCSVLALLRL
jgi:hypothetical protein